MKVGYEAHRFFEMYRFLSMMEKSLGESMDLLKQLDDGSITPGECLQKVRALQESVEREATRLGLPIEGVEKQVQKGETYN